ncbi:MAG: ABC transporter permease [Gemmatimonadetes bacterium]|nr:ABC transporter permease [Gemmatimonadota bacterium]
MLTGLWKLTWVEIKVFMREPMGVIGTLGLPVFVFLFVSRGLGDSQASNAAEALPFNVAILAALVIAVGAALSLVAIITIYREGGILKRLRATPLSPLTILGAHVFVKLIFTVVGMGLLVLAGRQFFPGALDVNLWSFTVALLLGTLSILSVGFVISSIVPTARFAQPIGSILLYPMIALSGLFFSIDALPTGWRVFANILPTTHAVALMQGIWDGAGWGAHWVNVLGLVAVFVVCSAVSTKTFRWE